MLHEGKLVWPNPICNIVGLAWTGFFAFSLLQVCAEGTNLFIPSFTAEGSLSTSIFASDGSSLVFQDEGKFLFDYSNGVWEIQITPTNTALGNIKGIDKKTFTKTIINCKRIPDGIRYFVVRAVGQSNQALNSVPQAIVEPIPFPPPDKWGLLACWFSLCPRPDLPIISSLQVRRFLLVNLFKNPNNLGDYSLAYLEPEHLFLSKFSITNDGTAFLSETERIKLGPPFENGYEELAYEAVKVTNVNGFAFPAETLLSGFAPRVRAKDRYDIYQKAVARLTVEKVDFGATANTKTDFATQQKLVALDRRASDLPNGESAPYFVKNDQWVSHTNREIALIAALTREHGKKMPANERHTARIIVIIVLAIAFITPFIYILLTWTHRQKPVQILTQIK
jgi:hypothetical protein